MKTHPKPYRKLQKFVRPAVQRGEGVTPSRAEKEPSKSSLQPRATSIACCDSFSGTDMEQRLGYQTHLSSVARLVKIREDEDMTSKTVGMTKIMT